MDSLEELVLALVRDTKPEHPLVAVWLHRLTADPAYTGGLPRPGDVTVAEARATWFRGHDSWSDDEIAQAVTAWKRWLDLSQDWPGLIFPKDSRVPRWRQEITRATAVLLADVEEYRRQRDPSTLTLSVQWWFSQYQGNVFERIIGKRPGYRPEDEQVE